MVMFASPTLKKQQQILVAQLFQAMPSDASLKGTSPDYYPVHTRTVLLK